MSEAKVESTSLKVAEGRLPPLKVYWPSEAEKTAFEEEAEDHSQPASQYARFILQARKDPILFLQFCRLRHPGFAEGLAGKPEDAGRLAALEREARDLRAAHEEALKERDEAEARCEELEKRLGQATERAQALAGQVLDLMKTQEANRARAQRAGTPFEGVPRDMLAVLKVLSVSPGSTRKEMEARLMEEGMEQADAGAAILTASRADLIVQGPGGRFRLARPVEGSE